MFYFNSWRKRNIFLGTVLFLSTSVWFTPVEAEENSHIATIKVSATGTTKIAPDMAVLNASVVREAKTAREALDLNNQAMSAVIDELKKSAIERRDLQTANFNIRPIYQSIKASSNADRDPKIVGYSVSNSLTIRVRELKILGQVLDKIVSLGVNSGGNVRFTNQDPTQAIVTARKNAMKKAIAKAQTLMDAAGAELGDIYSISEGVENHRPVPVAQASF